MLRLSLFLQELLGSLDPLLVEVLNQFKVSSLFDESSFDNIEHLFFICQLLPSVSDNHLSLLTSHIWELIFEIGSRLSLKSSVRRYLLLGDE